MDGERREFIIGASVLGVAAEQLSAVISRLAPLITFFHLDVTRAPWGSSDQGDAALAKRLRSTRRPVDVHWMGPEPEASTIDAFAAAGATYFTLQFEAFSDQLRMRRCIDRIRHTGMGVGLSVAPAMTAAQDTPIKAVQPIIKEIDLLNILTVVPGQSGQGFLERRTLAIARGAHLIRETGQDIILQIDGGLNSQTVKGVRPVTSPVRRVYLVSGSYLMRSSNPNLAVRLLQRDQG